MAHRLFSEIDKFETWAKVMLSEPSKISAEWETDYTDWAAIDEHFKDFIRSVPSSTWNAEELSRLAYIIARDNECGQLIAILPDDALVQMAEYALAQGERDLKWQMALELPRMVDKRKAIDVIERYANDPDGEVKKVALCALAATREGRVVTYDDLIRPDLPT